MKAEFWKQRICSQFAAGVSGRTLVRKAGIILRNSIKGMAAAVLSLAMIASGIGYTAADAASEKVKWNAHHVNIPTASSQTRNGMVTMHATTEKYDGNTGITVLSVPRASVDEETMNAISVAQLGNSLTTMQGALVIAVGSPLGTNYSILTGNITSTNNSISTIDNNYTVFTTDIVGSSDGSGVIVNVNGEVIGLVMQDYGNEADQSTLTALSISELKQMIEMMSNDMDVPYIGLQLSTVTNDIAKENEIPKGAYIKEVKMDSPAMAAGLQSGDVITKMGGETVYTVDSYESKLLALKPAFSLL